MILGTNKYIIILVRKQPYKYHEREKGEKMEQMTEKEQKQIAIEKFAAIQRIKKYGADELEYQEKLARAEMQALWIPTEELELN